MAKFKIQIGGNLPSFKLPVTFTCPDGKEATITMTVKHRSTDEMKDFYESEDKAPKGNAEFIRFMAEGWDLDDEFNDENISGFAHTSRHLSWRCRKLTWPRLRATVQKFKAGCLSHASA